MKRITIEMVSQGKIDKDTAMSMELAAIKHTGFNQSEVEDYLAISKAYDAELRRSGNEKQERIIQKIYYHSDSCKLLDLKELFGGKPHLEMMLRSRRRGRLRAKIKRISR